MKHTALIAATLVAILAALAVIGYATEPQWSTLWNTPTDTRVVYR